MRAAWLMLGASLLVSACSKVPDCGDSSATNLAKKIVADEIAGGSNLLKADQIASMVEVRNIQTVQKKDNPTAYSCKGDLAFTQPERLATAYAHIDDIGEQVKSTPLAPVMITVTMGLMQSLMSEAGNPLTFATLSSDQRQQMVNSVASRGLPLEYRINGVEKGEGGATFQVQVRVLGDAGAVTSLLLLDGIGQKVAEMLANQKAPTPVVAPTPPQPTQVAQANSPDAGASPSAQSSPAAAASASSTTPAAAVVAEAKPLSQPEVTSSPSKPVDDSPFAPSFDCQKVGSGAERLVCSDRDLSRLDVAVAQAYAKARDAAPDKAKLRAEQLDWMKTRRNGCADKGCMQDAYSKRLAELAN
jgi:uncharacterized protein YecT (DUF1311 family)